MCGILCYVRVSKIVLQQMFYDSNVIIQFRWKLICCFTKAMSALTGQKIFHVFPLKIVFWKLVTSVLCNVWGWAPNKNLRCGLAKFPIIAILVFCHQTNSLKNLRALQNRIYAFTNYVISFPEIVTENYQTIFNFRQRYSVSDICIWCDE